MKTKTIAKAEEIKISKPTPKKLTSYSEIVKEIYPFRCDYQNQLWTWQWISHFKQRVCAYKQSRCE
jgi:hypothetical protein